MIQLVLRNLVSNAIKFTPPGGRISIGASELNSFTEVYVQDSGKGIGSKELVKINNQEFYTTNGTAHEQGTGLGLMLCKEFLAKNDGHMRIESEVGRGSVFSFTLPLS
jgi:signal transduction histidine kinase